MYCYEFPRPAVTVDTVIFTLRDHTLSLLLVQRGGEPCKGCWALPGGFIDMDESLEDSARRELEEETGVSGVYLEQLYTFGDPGRDPRGRIITVAYYALVPSERIRLQAASDAAAVGWFSLDALPELAFDHPRIVAMAHERLVAKLAYSTIAFQFLPERFTLSELQAVYEAIQRKTLDKRNFRKWIKSTGQIEETGEKRRTGACRPAQLYRLKRPGEVTIIR